MLAIVISLLFGLAAFAAMGVAHASVIAGARRARHILAELAEMDRTQRLRVRAKGCPPRSLQPALAAA